MHDCAQFPTKQRVSTFKIKTKEKIMSSFKNGNAIFMTALNGLANTYSVLAQNSASKGGVTIEEITNPNNSVLQQLGNNTTFAQFLSSNFASIDRDGDGKISATDMSNLTSKLSEKGLTYEEICQLCSTGLGSSDMMNNILTYFDQIDTNKDGRITNAEIQAFGLKAEEERLKTEYQSFKSSSMSVFYTDESSSDEKASSLIDNLYPKNNS